MQGNFGILDGCHLYTVQRAEIEYDSNNDNDMHM